MTKPGLRQLVLDQNLVKEQTAAGSVKVVEDCEEQIPQLVPIPDLPAATSEEYFTSYDDCEVHRLMVRDRPRTEAYRRAILNNAHLFKGRTVLDVGAGCGVLSLFAKQAGARRVWAVEASGMASVLREVMELNDEEGVVKVVEGRAEEVDLGEKVDIIISEWMGFYLLHESMLDSVILARERHLTEDGLMFPSHCRLLAAPVTMPGWVQEQVSCLACSYLKFVTSVQRLERCLRLRHDPDGPESDGEQAG